MYTTYGTNSSSHRVTLDIKFSSIRVITPQVLFPYGETIEAYNKYKQYKLINVTIKSKVMIRK